MASSQEIHVLIVGAGITGLLIAHGLQNAGIMYSIFESEEAGQWRSKEWTMGIHWALPQLEGLLPPHLASRIVRDGSVDGSLNYEEPPNNGAYIYDGVTGEVLKDLTVPGRMVRVSRRNLRLLCQKDVFISWNHTLQTVTCNDTDNTVTAKFTNGKTCTGTILVGADGPRSPVRSFLFGPKPELAQTQPLEGVVNMSMCISYPTAEIAKSVRAAHPVWFMCISPEIFPFMSIQEGSDPDPQKWRFFIFVSWLGERDDTLDNAGRIKSMKTRAAKLAEPFRTAILSVPDETNIPYTDVGFWVAEPWDTRNGRVTLAGDACHPMPPYRGQGGNHAIQDAHNFVEVVKQIADAEASERVNLQTKLIKEYSNEVAKRGGEEAVLSTKNGRMLMAYSDFKESPYMKQGLSRGG